MTVAILVAVMISIVVGVSLIPAIMSSLPTDNIAAEVGEATGTGDMIVDILPYIFVAGVLLVTVVWMGSMRREKGSFDKSYGINTEPSGQARPRRGTMRGFLVGLGKAVAYPFKRSKRSG